MWSTAREIAEGDLVIVWMTRDLVQPLAISSGKELNTRFGVYRHAELIGVPYGSKIGSRNGKGFIHLLRPTPELWTLALPHRTQILYLADIAFITSWLDIKPGSHVIEAGTGSGSFSHSTARTVGPTGHLWSYEFHEARANKAREEFSSHGMDEIVTLTHRNVCKEGFTVVDTVDSVFLDLPAPWDAVEHAKKALRKDRATRICCFSPCMEQVQRTIIALNDAGFTEITMYETLIRPHQVDVTPPLPTVSTIGNQLKEMEARREAKRLRQIANSRSRGDKRKREETEDSAEDQSAEKRHADEVDGSGKRVRTEVSVTQELDATLTEQPTTARRANAVTTTSDAGAGPGTDGQNLTAHVVKEETPESGLPPSKPSVSKAFPEVRGHTSYLTFAILLPASAIAEASTNMESPTTEPTPEAEVTPATS